MAQISDRQQSMSLRPLRGAILRPPALRVVADRFIPSTALLLPRIDPLFAYSDATFGFDEFFLQFYDRFEMTLKSKSKSLSFSAIDGQDRRTSADNFRRAHRKTA